MEAGEQGDNGESDALSSLSYVECLRQDSNLQPSELEVTVVGNWKLANFESFKYGRQEEPAERLRGSCGT